MGSARAERERFSRQGPKRRRQSRRELPYGQRSLWGATVTNFKREREARRLAAEWAAATASGGAW